MSALTAVGLEDLSPLEAVWTMLLRGPCTARQLADRLIVNGYQWPGPNPVPTRGRVYDQLVTLEANGRAVRRHNPYDNGYVWRAR